METLSVPIQLRDSSDKRAARRLRRGGELPGVFYGPKSEPIPLRVNKKQLLKSVPDLEGSHLIRIESEASSLKDKVVLIKDIQVHAVTGEIQHLDFYEVDLSQKLTVKVPLHFVGKPEGVVKGGILQPVVREIEVECLPSDIPPSLDVDVAPLDIGHTFHVSELPMPQGVVAVYDNDFTLVTVVAPTVEETKAEEAAEAAPEGAEAAPAAAEEKPGEEPSGT
ncbi:MAG: 50S ribosomal protein L25 [Deltaproteobacteria bacterium]|nr:50S ribosomal protein L25 [Deltaproteobacteria bacterium]